MRHFVQTHAQYKGDSEVSEQMCRDLLTEVRALGREEGKREEVFPRPKKDAVPGDR